MTTEFEPTAEPVSTYASYPLAGDGTVRHWLACGPATSPLTELDRVLSPVGYPHGEQQRWTLNYWAYHPQVIRLKQRVHATLAPFTWQPGTPPVLDQVGIDERLWRYAPTHDDRMVDFSRFNFAPTLMRGWTYAVIHSEQAQTVTAEIYTIGPVQVWLNGALAYASGDTFSYVAPLTFTTTLALQAGDNPLYLHSLMPGWREARLALGLRFPDNPPLTVKLPLGDLDPAAWHAADAGLAALKVTQFAFPTRSGMLALADSAPGPLTVDVSIAIPTTGSPWAQFTFNDLPRAEARVTLEPGEATPLPLTENLARGMAQLPGENTLTLSLRPANGLPLERTHKIWLSERQYSHAPYGDYDSRRREAWEHLARMDYDVFATMAAVETGRRIRLSSEVIRLAATFLENRYDCADFYALSLLALLYRFGESPALLPGDRDYLEQTFLNFKYWIDEPGLDGMCYCTENHQILFHVTGYLAGQFWRHRQFANSGFTGKQQQHRSAERIRNWILRRLSGGFSEWDSNAYLTMDVFAMLSLVEFAESPRLRELATTLLHKTFFMIAAQSYRGAHGSTHGRCYVEGLKSARVENTSSLQRIAWGTGIFNGETRATGMLAMARRYRLPDILQKIGADVERTVVTRARSNAAYRPEFDMHSGEWDVRTLTRRTAGYMLSAALDYRPGESGVQQHLWQATLSPEAVIFTNYPGNNQEHGQARPNFWAGSVRLPRVAMADRTVICLYQIESHIGLGFSHAYFPTAMFDEWQIAGQWAFARYGQGYLALWGDGELRLTETGPHAMQELRSAGPGAAWICQAGSATEDGDFVTFRAQVMQQSPAAHGAGVRWQTPDGHALALDWTGPFTRDDAPVDSDDFPHYENAYTSTPMAAEVMDITFEGESLRLDLRQGKVL